MGNGIYAPFYSRRIYRKYIECDEGDLEWVKKKDVIKLPMWEGDRIFLDLIERDDPFFSLKLVYKGDRLMDAVLNGKRINRQEGLWKI